MKIRFNKKHTPIALFFLCLFSFGILTPWLGFYWDDWPYTWYAHVLGPFGYTEIFSEDRPILSLIYILTTFAGGKSPLQWQIFGIFCRWVAAVTLWWSLQMIWPRRTRSITWIAFLFAVYPGFGQQWISVIYSRAFLLYASFLFSLGCMAWAVRSKKWFWPLSLLSVICSTFAHLSTEYFFGLELLRPIIIWYILINYHENNARRLIQTIKLWIPYLLAATAYAIWRTFFFSSANYSIHGPQEMLQDPFTTLIQTTQTVMQTLVNALFMVWTQTLQILTQPLNSGSTIAAVGIALIAFLLVFLFLKQSDYNTNATNDPEINNHSAQDDSWGLQATILGILAIAFGVIPFWVASLPIKLVFPWDRFMLTLMFGASIFFVGILDLLIKTNPRKIILLSLAIAISTGYNFETANTFRRDWNNQKTFFWQLVWRIPAIEPDTIVLTHELPFTYYSDNSLTAPLNWTYAPEYQDGSLPYMMIYSKARLGRSLPVMQPETPVSFGYRGMSFSGNTSNSITINYTNSTCLRVLDTEYTNEKVFPEMPYTLKNGIWLSNLQRIIPNPQEPAQPPQRYFGTEPEPDWCYYFEKAELARQQADWAKVVELGNTAQDKGFSAKHPTEWLPFIEGYANTNDWETAESLTALSYQANPDDNSGLCYTWERISSDMQNQQDIDKIDTIMNNIQCK